MKRGRFWCLKLLSDLTNISLEKLLFGLLSAEEEIDFQLAVAIIKNHARAYRDKNTGFKVRHDLTGLLNEIGALALEEDVLDLAYEDSYYKFNDMVKKAAGVKEVKYACQHKLKES